MANSSGYKAAAGFILQGTEIDFNVDSFRVAGFKAEYVPNPDIDIYYAGITALYTPIILPISIPNVVHTGSSLFVTADAVTLIDPGGGLVVETLVIYKNGTPNVDDYLVAFLGSTDTVGLPLTLDGTNDLLQWPSGNMLTFGRKVT